AEAMNAAFVDDVAGVEGEEDEDDLEAEDGISDAPLVRLVNSLIFGAAEDGASDIHVEPQDHELIVRYRIDGVLHVAHRIPKRLAPGVTTRLKVLSKLDIAERRKPQDGRISLNAAAAGRPLDIRVATLPTVDGETARISIEAALTGHFVLSTLHTNDAPSAITRLNEMGVEPFLTGAAITAVLAQRLARKLCSYCAEPYEPTRDELLGLHLNEEVIASLEGET